MRKTETGVTDQPFFKDAAREATVALLSAKLVENIDSAMETFSKASQIHHTQLEMIDKKVSEHSQTIDTELFTEFAMRIKDNLQTLQKFDKELENMKNSRAYSPAALCAYAAVLQSELRGMLESLEDC